MKLPIKKKYFDQIKSGSKKFEFRDAHITFVCEETGRTITKRVWGVSLAPAIDIVKSFNLDEELFEDDEVIVFNI